MPQHGESFVLFKTAGRAGVYAPSAQVESRWEPGPRSGGPDYAALLLLGEVEGIRIGGEDQEQHAEFLRSRRLGRTAREAVRGARGGLPYG